MKRLGLLVLALVAVIAGCTGGVDTNPPPPGDDDDDAATTPVTPTPTGTVTPSPTPVPGLMGDPWTTTATPASDACALGTIEILYGNAGVATIGVATTGSDLYFDVGLHLNPAIGVGTEPSGTVDAGTGAFTQSFSYCTYDGLTTRKIYATWTGTFNVGMTAFDNSTLVEKLYVKNGNFLATCTTGVTTADAFGDCSSPGVTFTVDGVKQ